MVYFKQI